MSQLLALLDRLNRKERFFLVGHALGNHGFQLALDFRRELGNVVELAIPENAYCWMDYHLDWVFVALQLAGGEHPTSTSPADSPNFAHPDTARADTVYLNQNQEDVDLLVAFEARGSTRLIFVEAKGVTGWTNSQIRSKMARLATIFDDGGSPASGFRNVQADFVLASPDPPGKGLQVLDWYPRFAVLGTTFRWMKLPIPEDRIEASRPANGASTWFVKPSP